MLSNHEIQFKIVKIVAEQLDCKEHEINHEYSLESLGADSLDQMEILMKTEEVFNIEISDTQSEKIFYIQDLVKCVDDLIKNI